MLIHWEWDENSEALLASQNLAPIVSDILRARRMGTHLIVIDRRLSTRLQQLDLSQSDRAILNRLGHEFTQTGSLHRFSPNYIRVSNSANATASRLGAAFIVPLTYLRDTRLLDFPVLLVENLDSDGWLLSMCMKVSAECFRRGPLSFDLAHGGGDDIHKVLSHLIRAGRAVHAVVDSDRNSPHPTTIGKMKRLERVIGASNSILARASALPCREAENLIPSRIVVQTPAALGKQLNTIAIEVEDAETASGTPHHDRYWSYVDLKNGLNPAKFLAMTEDEQEWITSKLLLAGEDATASDFDGYGNTLVPQIRDNGSLAGQLRAALKGSEWREAFAGFFDPVCWFFLGTTKVIT